MIFLIIFCRSPTGMFMHIFSISNEQSCMCSSISIFASSCVNVLESLTLNKLGNATLLFNILSVFANSHHGHSFQFIMGLIGFPVFCSFTVAFIFWALGFMSTNSICLLYLLYVYYCLCYYELFFIAYS